MSTENTSTAIVLILRNPIQVSLFNEVLVKEISVAGGHWHGANPKDHHLPFVGLTARVAEEGETLGINVPLLKNNYNFNDSNWVNPPATLQMLTAAAVKGNGGKDVPKKELVSHLEDIKTIMKTATKALVAKKPAADAVAAAAASAAGAAQAGSDQAPNEDDLTVAQKAARDAANAQPEETQAKADPKTGNKGKGAAKAA